MPRILLASFFLKAILAAAITVVLVPLLWKLGKLADAYTERMRTK
jgi:hypothetical protein